MQPPYTTHDNGTEPDSTTEPTTSAYSYTENDCANEPSESIVPFVSLTASTAADVYTDDEVALVAGDITTGVVEKWYLGDVLFNIDWQEPTALIVVDNGTTYNTSYAVTELPTADEWMTLVIESTFAIPHPIHLHGHDFFVLAYGDGTYADAAPTLNTANPPRRDVQMLPAAGYLVIAFQADNPGVWLAHCHIGWHTDQGFALQFVERYDEITALYNATELRNSCDSWDAFQESSNLEQTDDGI